MVHCLESQEQTALQDSEDPFAICVNLLAKLKAWSDRAKEKILLLYGQEKSSLRRKPIQTNPRVGQQLYIRGLERAATEVPHRGAGTVGQAQSRTASAMSRCRKPTRDETERELRVQNELTRAEEYFRGMIQSYSVKESSNVVKWGLFASRRPQPRRPSQMQGASADPFAQKNLEVLLERKRELSTATFSSTSEETAPPGTAPIGQSAQAGTANVGEKTDLTARSRVLSKGDGTSALLSRQNTGPGQVFVSEGRKASEGQRKERERGKLQRAGTEVSGGAGGGAAPVLDRTKSAQVAKKEDTQTGVMLVTRPPQRPYYYISPLQPDVIRGTLHAYERIAGVNFREFARESLRVANSFKERSAIGQVNRALSLTRQQVRKTLNNENSSIREAAKSHTLLPK